MPDDAEFLRQYVESGSDAAFAAFVRARVDLVYSAAVRRMGGDAHLAHDVTQRVFCTAALQAAALARHPHPTAWLYETTRFTASSMMRGERRRKLRERIQGEEAQLTAGSDPPWERLGPLMDEAIDRLGPGDRTAILLRFFDGLAFPEIAERLALTEGGARQRVDRAVDKIRRILTRKGITSTAAGLAVALEGQAIGAAPAGLASTLSAHAVGAAAAMTHAGGAVAAKSLFFMSTTKSIIIAVALVAIGSTLYQVTQTHRTADALTAATRERDGAKAALATLTRERDDLAGRLAAEEKQRKELQDQMATTGRGGPGRAGGRAGRGGAVPGGALAMADIQTLIENPEYRALQARALEGDLDQRYAALFKKIGFTVAQANQFKSLLVEKQQAASLAAAAADPTATLANPNALTQAIQTAQAPVDARIKAALGNAGYDRYQQYEQTVRERATVSQLQQSLSYTPTPLTDDQTDRMIQILQQAAPPIGRGGRGLGMSVSTTMGVTAGSPNPIGRNATIPITDQIVGSAQAVLSPDQLQALKQLQSQQQAQQQMQQVMGAAGIGGAIGRGAP